MSVPVTADFQQAAHLYQLGSTEAAAGLCEAALRRDHRHPGLRHLLAVIRLNQGQVEQSIQLLRRLAKDLPTNSAILVDLGQALERAGKPAEAEPVLQRAAKLDPKSPLPWLALGAIRELRGQFESASTAYRQACVLAPDSVDAHTGLGNTALLREDVGAAIASFERAVEIASNRPELWFNLGNAYRRSGRVLDAERAYRTGLDLGPDHVLGLYNLGLLLFEEDRALEALAYLERAAIIDPSFLPARFNLGLLLADARDVQRALEHLGAVVAQDPTHTRAETAYAECLARADQREEAERRLRGIVEANPDSLEAWKALASVLLAQGQFLEAMQALERALPVAPDDIELLLTIYKTHLRLGQDTEALSILDRAFAVDVRETRACLARLALGAGDLIEARRRFEEIGEAAPGETGWKADLANVDLLEGKINGAVWQVLREAIALARGGKASSARQLPPTDTLPSTLAGKTILVCGDQGIGDELFFLRWIMAIRERGGRIVYQARSDKLVPLLRRQSLGIDSVLAPGDAQPPADYSVWINELPAVLSPQMASPENGVAFSYPRPVTLETEPARMSRWRARLDQLGPPPYIGITWRAGATFNGVDFVRKGLRNLTKQVSPAMLASALSSVRATFVILQRNPLPADLEAFRDALGMPVHDLSQVNDDLEDALAVLGSIDAYIGVSNTNMHLLASLTKKAHVLVPWVPEWRWMANGDASPWFPGFDLYRQTPTIDWQTALSSLSRNLVDQLGDASRSEVHDQRDGSRGKSAISTAEHTQSNAPQVEQGSHTFEQRADSEVQPRTPASSDATPVPVISAEYRRMQEELHRNPNYGVASIQFAPTVAEFIHAHQIRELLDYGAGKGRLGQELKKIVHTPLVIHHYEPAVAHWAAAAAPRELVACIDVLEHIEPDLLDNVLDDLKRVVRRYGMFTIATGPAGKFLSDGRNAHLIQKPPAWWLPKLMVRFGLVQFNRIPQGFLVIVEPLGR